MIGARYLFDMPVYRLAEARYNTEREQFIERHLKSRPVSPAADAAFESHLREQYGGPWHFNEVVGQLRLFLLGTQIRAELYFVNRKRLVRTRTKTLLFRELKFAGERSFGPGASSADIWLVVQEHVKACKRELPRRFVDSSQLDTIGPFIDWRRLCHDV